MAFVKGQSGNPGGRSRELQHVIRLAQEHGPAAIAALANIMGDTGAPPAARVAAATHLLDRGFGKPAQPLTGADGEGAVRFEVAWSAEGSAAE